MLGVGHIAREIVNPIEYNFAKEAVLPLYKKRHFPNVCLRYVGEGMEEGEFSEAREGKNSYVGSAVLFVTLLRVLITSGKKTHRY